MSPAHEALVGLIPRLRRYARVLCGDAACADDLVQDTLERVCERLSQWRPGSDLRAWSFTIMHNLYVSELRRPRYRHEFHWATESGAPVRADSATGGPARSYERDATGARQACGGAIAARAAELVHDDPATGWALSMDLERALQALPDNQRQVMLLIAFEDMSYEQVADVIGVPVGTVMSRLSRGRMRLRSLLDPDAARPAARPDLKVLK